MDLSERAKNEIDAVKAIFMDDFKEIDTDTNGVWKTTWKKPSTRFLLNLKPLDTSSTYLKHRQIYIVLDITLPLAYPTKCAQVNIQTSVGVGRDKVRDLHEILVKKTKELEGQEMIYELAATAQEYLTKHIVEDSVQVPPSTDDGVTHSLYDEMILRQRMNEREKKKLAEQENKQKMEIEREKESLLTLQIEEELMKKRLRVNEEREKRKHQQMATEIEKSPDMKLHQQPPHQIQQQQNLPKLSSSFASRYSYGPYASSTSRYRSDFYELEFLGKGSYGEVVKAQNRLDGRVYAIKKLKLDPKDYEYNKRMIREVTTLSRLHHVYVVRYYQAWLEGPSSILESETNADDDDQQDSKTVDSFETGDFLNDSTTESLIQFDYSNAKTTSNTTTSPNETTPTINKGKSSKTWADVAKILANEEKAMDRKQRNEQFGILYIQMEYCENKTLKDLIIIGMDENESWRLFRQILEGLSHIHQQGMVHRDLKPTNIFMDAHGDVKIGDFGLATNLEFNEEQSSNNSSSSDLGEMTTGVGTTLYMAPEILGRRVKYNQKVDMYSLGIIFFECVYHFDTQMERVNVLKNLRRSEIKFPPDFPNQKLQKQEFIIKWLLQHDPDKRPLANELLESEHLPPRMENETINETLRTICKPDTPFYNRLIKTLFEQQVEISKDFTYDFNSSQQQYHFDERKSVVITAVKDVAAKIFKRHGAIEFTSPLLLPKSLLCEDWKSMGIVRLLDSDGTLVELPFDLTLSFARWAARNDTRYLKRWCFDRVYRQNISGGQPKVFHEADFDIVHSTQSLNSQMAYETEILLVVTAIIDDLPQLRSRGYFIKLNHWQVVEEIFNKAKVPVDKRIQVSSILNSLPKLTWAQVAKQLENVVKLDAVSIKILYQFVELKGISSVEKLLAVPTLSQIFNDLRQLEILIRAAGISCPLIFSPLSTLFNYHYYQDCVMFQVLLEGKRPEIIAAGGRYNRLIARYRHPSVKNIGIGAVGVNIAIGKIANIISSSHFDSFSRDIRQACDILVASFGRISLAERMNVCVELWNANFSVDYVIEDGKYNIEELLQLCRSRLITWLIILKDRRSVQPLIKVRNVFWPNQKEIDIVRKEDLVEMLLSQMKEFEKHQGISVKHRTQSASHKLKL